MIHTFDQTQLCSVLKSIEFGDVHMSDSAITDDRDEQDQSTMNTAARSLETLLMVKQKQLQTECAQLRNRNAQMQGG